MEGRRMPWSRCRAPQSTKSQRSRSSGRLPWETTFHNENARPWGPHWTPYMRPTGALCPTAMGNTALSTETPQGPYPRTELSKPIAGLTVPHPRYNAGGKPMPSTTSTT
eukprot:8347756-Pyramimonas_sp.AAC.1